MASNGAHATDMGGIQAELTNSKPTSLALAVSSPSIPKNDHLSYLSRFARMYIGGMIRLPRLPPALLDATLQ